MLQRGLAALRFLGMGSHVGKDTLCEWVSYHGSPPRCCSAQRPEAPRERALSHLPLHLWDSLVAYKQLSSDMWGKVPKFHLAGD